MERFTERARKVMAMANQEAQRFNHEYIGTEHILLGLIKEGSGVGANVLRHLKVDLPTAREQMEKLIKPGDAEDAPGRRPQTPRAKKVIECAIEHANGLNHNYIGSEHLLLGLLSVRDGVACRVLNGLGVDREVARSEVLTILGFGTGEKADPATDELLAEVVGAWPRLEPTLKHGIVALLREVLKS